MAKIQIKNILFKRNNNKQNYNLKECRQEYYYLENGEEIQRGCGLLGLYRRDLGRDAFTEDTIHIKGKLIKVKVKNYF